MLNKIKNINPRAITDFAQMQELLIVFMNVIESQAKSIEEQAQKIQELEDEINRLKGEHGSLPPNSASTNNSPSEEKTKRKPRKKNHKKGGKKAKIQIDKVIKCEIDKSVLPADAKFQGYRTVVQQDVIIKRNNTLYKIPVYYSKSGGQTYSGSLPEEYEGEFGGQLKSWLQLLHHYCDVTQGRLKALMDNLGILISTGTMSNIPLSNTDKMVEECQEILRSGLEYIPYTQMDGTKSWESGQGKSTQIISTPYYSIYHTMSAKSKANIIWALQGKSGDSVPLLYNNLTIELLKDSKVPKKGQKLLQQLLSSEQCYTLDEFESLLTMRAPHLLEKATYAKMIEILALAYYLYQTDFARVQNLLSDAGPEYIGIATHHALCWLHEERHYKKMMPKLQVNQMAVQQVRSQIWDYYKKLLNFKELPPDIQAQEKPILDQEFDQIFTQETDYDDLNYRIEKTFSKKEKLLRVLEFPDLPLHNNTAELAVRRKVRKRDISLHTMSVMGTKAQDAFMSVVETAAKLGVNALDYLYDRITNKYQMQSLAELIKLNTL